MTKRQCCVLVLLVGCNHQPAPTPGPRSRTVSAPVVYVDSATFDSIKRANPPDSGMLAFRHRYDSLAALVDTIVVLSPDSILIHVGQSVDMSVLRNEARRGSGEALPTYPGFIDIEDRSIANFNETGIGGLKPGRTRLVLTVANTNAHVPPSYVWVAVIP